LEAHVGCSPSALRCVMHTGIRLNRDNRWSIAYSEELISSKISATL
jgi:hypothetical protein